MRFRPQPGRLIAVVGPSGVGKDSVIAGLQVRRSDLGRVRRAITRPADAGGEAIESLTRSAFEAALARGAFALSWEAHGLGYGIPAGVHADVAEGRDMLVNLSRSVLAEARGQFPTLIVLALTARAEVLAERLAGRRREDAAGIAARLARSVEIKAGGAEVIRIDNSGPLDTTVAAAMAALYGAVPPVRGAR